MKRHWSDVTADPTTVLRTTGLGDVEAEEMAIFPGMEELSAMLYVNQYHRDKNYDVILLYCAPTAESLRFVSLPTTLDWYIKNIFGFQRTMLKAARPLLNRIAPVELPPEKYFQNLESLFEKIGGIDMLLKDPLTTSVRLVTNAEKMVLRETQRAFVYFSLQDGLTVDPDHREPRVSPINSTTPFLIPGELAKRPRWRKSIATLTRCRSGEFPYHRTRCLVTSGCGCSPTIFTNRATIRWPSRGPKRLIPSCAATATTRCGYFFPSLRRPRLAFSKRMTNWWWKSARCEGTSVCPRRWPLTPTRARLEDRMLIVEMRSAS